MRHTSLCKTKGFTLIEMVMALMIISIISVIVGGLITEGFKTFQIGNVINELSDQTLIGIERISDDLRTASSLTTIASNSLTFVDQAGTSYSYSVSGSNLQRSSYTLLNNLQSVAFTYLDSSGSVTATPASVKYVKIALTLSKNNIPINYTTLISLQGVY